MAEDEIAQTVTRILRSGVRSEELLPLVYDELRKLAHARMASERAQTLEPTALVHEAYLRLVHGGDVDWSGRGHFFGAAARAMQRILIDRARARLAQKRGGEARRITMDAAEPVGEEDPHEVLALEDALDELERLDPRKCEVVRLRYFAGLSVDDTALALGISRTTVKDEWAFSRAWLLARLGSDH
ncbi:MAG: sigma-70 family RNA polymerase sigma factor [Planctomycetes bacterium]|nr:sigma-70 family RNA polymerase sigma factor [Planctomycetota bacterium]